MIFLPFFEIPHGDRLAKNIKSLCVQVISRSTASTGKYGFEFDYMYIRFTSLSNAMTDSASGTNKANKH